MGTKACWVFFFCRAPMRVELKDVISVVGGSRNLFGNGH